MKRKREHIIFESDNEKSNEKDKNISYRTRSKKPKLLPGLTFSKKKFQWISATKTHNYMRKDTLCDWLKLYGKRQRTFSFEETNSMFSHETFKTFLLKKGVEFEKKVVDYLKTKFKVEYVSDYYTKETAKITLDLIKQGVPIIHSAPLYNQYNKTYGIIDLIVRSDYLNKIVEENVLSTEEEKIGCKYHDNFHYRVIDVKYHTLHLSSDGIHMRNSDRIPAYKSQLYIYNEIISSIQKYKPDCAYILGRRWDYVTKGQHYSSDSCVSKLGVIDFKEYDSHIPDMSRKAISWYRNVLKNGVNWVLSPPSNKNLYPNMCVDSGEWNQYKEKLANDLSEVTMLWNCGVKHRDNVFKNGIKSWKDPKCTAESLGVYNAYKNIVNSIIHINRDSEEKILPKKIKHNQNEWKNEKPNEMFVDFETFSDLCQSFDQMPLQPRFNVIYMIGVGWKSNGEWKYKSFICKKPTYNDEYETIKDFIRFYRQKGSPPIYYWHAERSFWINSLKKLANLNFDVSNFYVDKWIDLVKLFKNREEPIVVKGCFGFGLKNIVKQMKKYGMINTQMDSECKNGMMAMVKAWNCYTNFVDPVNSPVMKDIEKYNEFDCKSLYDIIHYLRQNHA